MIQQSHNTCCCAVLWHAQRLQQLLQSRPGACSSSQVQLHGWWLLARRRRRRAPHAGMGMPTGARPHLYGCWLLAVVHGMRLHGAHAVLCTDGATSARGPFVHPRLQRRQQRVIVPARTRCKASQPSRFDACSIHNCTRTAVTCSTTIPYATTHTYVCPSLCTFYSLSLSTHGHDLALLSPLNPPSDLPSPLWPHVGADTLRCRLPSPTCP